MRLLMTATSDFEREIVCGRLREAGVEPLEGGKRPRGVAVCDVYVEDDDLERAREALAEAEGASDDELTRLSEEAGGAGERQPEDR